MQIEELKAGVEQSKDKVLSAQLESLLKQIEEESYVTKQTFDEYIFSPIVRKRQMQDGYQRRRRPPVGGYQSAPGRQSYRRSLIDSEEKLAL